MKTLPDIGLYAFWDIDKTSLDFNRDKDFVISRMFERGKLDDILKIVSYYGIEETREVLITDKYLSRDGLYLANALLDIPPDHFASYALLQHH